MKGLIETFNDQTPLLASLVLLERRPVLVKGYVESKIMRELRFLVPHRDVYEVGRNIPRTTNGAKQFFSNLLGAEELSPAESTPRRCLILAPSIDRQFVEALLSFNRAWVASCVTTPQQETIQKSNAAIYDINEKKWLNIDVSLVKTSWMAKVIYQAMTKSNEELARAYLDLMITEVSKKASTLYRYVCAGMKERSEIWRDLGEPNNEEQETLISLCKAEYNIDARTVLADTRMNKDEKSLRKKMPPRGTATQTDDAIGRLAERIAAEEERLKRCLETVKSCTK